MTKVHSNTRQSADKPSKPFPDFPLTPHATGRWCKKIRGKIHYFGRWDDPQGALNEYLEIRDYLHAGKDPPAHRDGATLKDLCNSFLNDRKHRLDAGELTERSWADYRTSCDRVIAIFGKNRMAGDLQPDDFLKLRGTYTKRRWGAHTIANETQRVRVLFNYGWEAGLLEKPVRFGPSFKRPKRSVMRREKAAKGKRLFEAEQIRDLLHAADTQLKAMILLGINCAFGNADCGRITINAINGDWLDFPRPKTGVDRRVPLWTETLDSLEKVIAERKPPRDQTHSSLVFITKYGGSWYNAKSIGGSAISAEFRKLLDREGLYRPGLSFYALRHTFQTIGDEARDPLATSHIMGHVDGSIGGTYRERISDKRLRAVVDRVHAWLWGV